MAKLFSQDGQHVVFQTSDGKLCQLVDLNSKHVYLQIEGEVLHYNATVGALLWADGKVITWRDLKPAVRRLKEVGVPWLGPTFSNPAQPPLLAVHLDKSDAPYDDYSTWMDKLDARTMREAELHPADGHALFMAAQVCVEHHQLQRALELFRKSSEQLPQALTPIQWQAYVLAAQGELEPAVQAATRVLDRRDLPDLRLQRGSWLLELKRPQAALEDAEQVASSYELLKMRANTIELLAHRMLGNVEQEQLCIERMREQSSPTRSISYSVWLRSTADISLWNTAMVRFNLTRIGQTTDPEVIGSIAWGYMRCGDYQKALDLAAQLDYPPESPEFAFDLCLQTICLARQGNKATALELLERLNSLRTEKITPLWDNWAREFRIVCAEARLAVEALK